MRPHETSRTFQVLGILILGLVVAAPALYGQQNPEQFCRGMAALSQQEYFTGTVEGVLDTRTEDLILEGSGNWSGTQQPILKDQAVAVPANSTVLLTITSLDVEEVRFQEHEKVVTGHFRPVAPAVWYTVNDDDQLLLCIKNLNQTQQDRAWSFGVMVDGEWYDPQLKNEGEGGMEPPS